jgi:hypothetical protein
MAITISGSGIVEANLADNAVTLAKMAGGTDGEILTYDASGNPVAVSVGTDGQVLTSGGVGVAPAFEAAAAGGKLLQVVSTTYTGTVSTTSSSMVTAYGLSITPTSTSSKILVITNFNIGTGYNSYPQSQLARGTTAIGSNTYTASTSADTNDYAIHHIALTTLDSPSTTSSVTYNVRFKSAYLNNTIYMNVYASGAGGSFTDYRAPGSSTITLMEIGA